MLTAIDTITAGEDGEMGAVQEWFRYPMTLTAEQLQIASLIDAQMRQLAGSDDITTFGEMADYLPDVQRLIQASTRGEMDALCQRFEGFFRYAKILEQVAAGIQSGAIKVPD